MKISEVDLGALRLFCGRSAARCGLRLVVVVASRSPRACRRRRVGRRQPDLAARAQALDVRRCQGRSRRSSPASPVIVPRIRRSSPSASPRSAAGSRSWQGVGQDDPGASASSCSRRCPARCRLPDQGLLVPGPRPQAGDHAHLGRAQPGDRQGQEAERDQDERAVPQFLTQRLHAADIAFRIRVTTLFQKLLKQHPTAVSDGRHRQLLQGAQVQLRLAPRSSTCGWCSAKTQAGRTPPSRRCRAARAGTRSSRSTRSTRPPRTTAGCCRA